MTTENTENTMIETEETRACDNCSAEITESNAALTCGKCSADLCEKCADYCSVCSAALCADCVKTCDQCGSTMCADCATTCSDCGAEICSDCARSCDDCGSTICPDCARSCDNCGNTICESCARSCDDCGSTLCESCAHYCDECDSTICESCADRRHSHDDDRDGANFSWSDYQEIVYSHEFKPDEWPKFRTNRDQYRCACAGIELEINHTCSQFSAVTRAANKALKGKFLWKEDGSIHAGGSELVTAPMSLNYWRSIGAQLRSMCSEMVAAGATSYEEDECGLHIHYARAGVNSLTLRKLRAFFCANRAALVSFSKRTEDREDSNGNEIRGSIHWCDIPEKENSCEWHDRYVAINPTEHTIEFRLYRGTFDYNRIKASLLFTHAIVQFCKAHGLGACRSARSFAAFAAWCAQSGQYAWLYRYLCAQGLCKRSVRCQSLKSWRSAQRAQSAAQERTGAQAQQIKLI